MGKQIEPKKSRRDGVLIEIGFYSLLFLFFFQLITAFIEATYAFGLLGTSFPVEAVSILLFFTPLLWLVLPRKRLGTYRSLLVILVLVSRMAEIFLDTRWKMILSGLGVGAFLLLFPLLLQVNGNQDAAPRGYRLGIALLFALGCSIFLRSLYSGNDLTDYGLYRFINWGLAAGGFFLFWLYRKSVSAFEALTGQAAWVSKGVTQSRARGKVSVWVLGIFSVWVLLYFAFTSPNVIARWTGLDLLPILVVLLSVLTLFSFIAAWKAGFLQKLSKEALLIWNILFALTLVLTILAHQIPFPASPEGFPLSEPAVPWWGDVALYAALIFFPIIFLDFMIFVREIILSGASLRRMGGNFTLGSLYLLLIIFAHIFTTVYDYIPVVGPIFRDRFWLVYLIPGLLITAPFLYKSVGSRRELRQNVLPGMLPGIGLLVLAIFSLVSLAFRQAQPPQPPEKNTLRILTYNIQQGYGGNGLKSLPEQLDVLRAANLDIIGLVESDTNRVSGGNSDPVRYFADQLDMYSYYGPKTVTGTFGIALLSRYPIKNPETFFMYSQGEQTAAILAQVTVGGSTFNILVTHLGNGGPIIQQQQVLERLQGLDNVIAMGDFNFRPDTEQYALTTQVLSDSWLLTDVPDKAGQEIDPLKRIDHIFVSPGMAVRSSQYIISSASDHPAMLTELGW